MPRIQRFAHAVQRRTYVNFFRPEREALRPDDVLTSPGEAPARHAAWSATSYSGFVPYRDPPVR